VADFHRLPEHPGDCRFELRRPSMERPNRHGTIFHDINVYSRAGPRSQNAFVAESKSLAEELKW
jgi:hypothetical protein